MVGIERLLGDLEPFIREYGAAAVMVILTGESLGLPLPGESLLILASVLAGRGELSLPLLMLSARSEERRVGKECRSRWSPYH